jgi:hypothetical protein
LTPIVTLFEKENSVLNVTDIPKSLSLWNAGLAMLV